MAQNFNTGIHGKKNSPSRSGHDLSQKKAFTAKVGELLPIYWHFATPGSKWTITPQHFSRTQPLNTSAFVRIREHVDFYEVPFTLLWKSARQFLLGTGEVNPVQSNSPLSAKQLGDYFPTVSLQYISQAILWTSVASTPSTQQFINEFGFLRGLNTYKLLTYLGYGALLNIEDKTDLESFGVQGTVATFYNACPAYGISYQLNILPLLAYQKVYADYFRNSQWEKVDVGTYNIDFFDGRSNFVTEVTSLAGRPNNFEGFFDAIYGCRTNGLSGQSAYGYTNAGNSAPCMFDLRYALWDNDLFHSVVPNTQFGEVSAIDLSSQSSVPVTLNGSITGVKQDDLNIFHLANEKFGSGASISQIFGSIGATENGFIASRVGNSDSEVTLGLTSTKPSMFDGASPAYIALDTERLAKYLSVTGEASAASFKSSFNILQLRAASAIQRLREIQEFNHYDSRSQVDAIYGYQLPREAANLAIYRGGYTSNLDINDVVNTNLQGDNQAVIAGKGTSSGRSSFSFTASDFSVIIGIYYAVPILDYDNSQIDPSLFYARRDDFPNPMLDSIGLEPVLIGELTNRYNNTPSASLYSNFYTLILGYTSRYYSMKTKLDNVTGAFVTTLKDWVAPFAALDILQYSFGKVYGSSLLPSQENLPSNVAMSALAFFHVYPGILDSVFAVKADDTWDTDQLLVNMYTDVKAVLPYSRSGLPY